MRRTDREITDYTQMLKILDECDCCRLGFSTERGAYIVPMNFGYEDHSGRLSLYFHSAAAGRKLELLRAQPLVGFELDCGHRLMPGDRACSYSFAYRSIIGTGRMVLLTDPAAQTHALRRIMAHYAPAAPADRSFDPAALAHLCVLRLDVDEWACKMH